MIRNRKDLAKVKRIVVKVGTSTITYPNCSRNFARIDHLCRELADLHNKGLEVILVTSGAVAVGSERLVAMTNFDNSEALYRFQLIWKRLKIEEALLEAGIQEGQTVRILDMVFNYQKSKWADRE